MAAQRTAMFLAIAIGGGLSFPNLIGGLAIGALLAASSGIVSTLFRGEYATRLARAIFCRDDTTTPSSV